MKRACTSCGKDISADRQSASFPCPQCQGEIINRCRVCRKTAVHYFCAKCKFEGP